MSARFQKVYCKCGERIQGNPTYCRHCGIKVGEVDSDADPLSTVTEAVRDFHENASEEAKEKKYNQQKWGLFETNYQREKGITLDESLKEIEEFSRDGTVPEPAPKKNPTVGGAFFRENLDGKLQEKEEEKRQKSGAMGLVKRLSKRLSMSRSGSSSSTATAGSKTGGGSHGGTKAEFAKKLAEPTSSAGAAFFSQFQEKEKKKFMPQYGMN